MAGLDLLISGATVMPGDGSGFLGDVGIVGGRIAEVTPRISTTDVGTVVDATGLMLCPGFIDMHAHSALEPFRDPRMTPKVAQGFTTEVINPDGLAPAPVSPDRWRSRRDYMQPLEGAGPKAWMWSTIAEYLDALADVGPATTLVPSVAHSAVRERVMGSEARAPDRHELGLMRDEARKGFEAGARMLSFGLIYAPGLFAETDELVALASEAARVGAPVAVHVRNEAVGVLESVTEMIDVCRRSGASLHVSHLKAIGNAELIEPLLALLESASADIDVTFDQYPYGAGSTTLGTILPPWSLEGGAEAIVARLNDPSQRRRIVGDIGRGIQGWENPFGTEGPEAFTIAESGAPRADDTGKTLEQVAVERGVNPLIAALDLLAETNLAVAAIDTYATEESVRTIFRHPLALVGSDGIFSAHPHPRLYGTAARVLGRYAIRERIIPVEEAIARLTARAADRLLLADRGRVRRGLRADLVLLDPRRFVDTATYDDPVRVPDGVHLVLVGGRSVLKTDRQGASGAGGVVREPLPVRLGGLS